MKRKGKLLHEFLCSMSFDRMVYLLNFSNAVQSMPLRGLVLSIHRVYVKDVLVEAGFINPPEDVQREFFPSARSTLKDCILSSNSR